VGYALVTALILCCFAGVLIFVLPELVAAPVIAFIAFGGSFVWCRHRLIGTARRKAAALKAAAAEKVGDAADKLDPTN
jgi:hypothetical protein